MGRWFDVGWVILWGAVSSAWCLSAARDLSATFDEPFYLEAGLGSWHSGSNNDLMRKGTMPLPVDVEYLPIYVWERCRGVPFDRVRDFHTILPYARAANLVFWWLLLIYGTLLARRFGGAWAGRFAVVLLATEPNFLGHACLATTDISVTALLLAFAFHYELGRGRGRFRRWVVPGALYGLAIAAKASALTFAPLIVLGLELPNWYWAGLFRPAAGVGRWRHLWRGTANFRFDAAKSFAIATVVLWVYCGCDWKPQPSFVKWAAKLPDDGWRDRMSWLATNLTVFPNAGEGLMYQVKHNIRGHDGVYLLGEWHVKKAVWYYFPVALTIKLSVPVLMLIAMLALRPRTLATPLTLVAVLLLIFSLNCRVQIGIRLMFPLVSFLILVIAVGLARAIAGLRPVRQYMALLMAAIAVGIPAVMTWPDGIRYANELWGGPNELYRFLGDSNDDWGQGVIDLDQWTADRGLPPAVIWYYGLDPTITKDLTRVLPLHDDRYNIREPADTRKHVAGKVVAVSLTLRFSNPRVTPTMETPVEFFADQAPIGRSRSFVIYDFRKLTPPNENGRGAP